jgi:hypothetical protein
MSKLIFNSEDFCQVFGDCRKMAVERAQAIYDRWLSAQAVVYTPKKYDVGHTAWNQDTLVDASQGATHKARIVCIEPLECAHTKTKIWEPHLAGARKCLDCEKVYNPNRTPNWQIECSEHIPEAYNHIILPTFPPQHKSDFKCKICGVKLKKTWEAE